MGFSCAMPPMARAECRYAQAVVVRSAMSSIRQGPAQRVDADVLNIIAEDTFEASPRKAAHRAYDHESGACSTGA